MWWCEVWGVRVWGCEGVRVWGCECVKMSMNAEVMR